MLAPRQSKMRIVSIFLAAILLLTTRLTAAPNLMTAPSPGLDPGSRFPVERSRICQSIIRSDRPSTRAPSLSALQRTMSSPCPNQTTNSHQPQKLTSLPDQCRDACSERSLPDRSTTSEVQPPIPRASSSGGRQASLAVKKITARHPAPPAAIRFIWFAKRHDRFLRATSSPLTRHPVRSF